VAGNKDGQLFRQLCQGYFSYKNDLFLNNNVNTFINLLNVFRQKIFDLNRRSQEVPAKNIPAI